MRTTLRTADLRSHGEAEVYTRSRTPWQRAPLLPFSVPPPPFAWLLWPFIIVALTGLTFSLGHSACSSTAAAQRDRRAELALAVAVVAAHEGALDNLRDTALVWQVVEHRARTTAARLSFLRSHSPLALGLPSRKGPCLAGMNCEWSVELLRAPSKTPSSVNAGYWNTVRAPQWELIQRKALGLVYGVDDDRPCPVDPYSWGFGGDVEHAWRVFRLVPAGSVGTLNECFVFAPAPRVLSAEVAKGSNP